MDISKLSRGQMIAGAGGVLLIISLFLSWISVPFGSASAFDSFSGMDIIMLIIAIIALAWAASAVASTGVTVPAHAAMIVALLGVLALGWAFGWDLENPNAGIGAWLGLVAAAAIAYGGLVPGSPTVAARRPTSTTAGTNPPPPPTTPTV